MKLKIQERFTLVISWNEPNCAGPHGIKGYIVYYKIVGSAFDKTDLIKCCDHRISNLREGTDYEVLVVAVDNQGIEGMQSKIGSIKTGCKLQY